MLAALFAILPLLALTSASPIAKRQSNVLITSGRNGQCLSVQGGRQAVSQGQIGNDTPVVTVDCSSASYWDISRGSGSVLVTGTNYALDLGLNPRNNGNVKVYQSYPGAPQQTWYLTDDNRIAQTGGNQCLDEGDNGPQTYECTTGNTNQVWNVQFGGAAPTTSASAPSQTSPASNSGFLSNIPVTTGSQNVRDVAGDGSRLHLTQRQDLCLMVAKGFAAIGTPVVIEPCGGQTFAGLQKFDLPNGTGEVRLHNDPNNLCLDAGSNPSNGGPATVYTCGGYPQQQWTFENGQLRTANNQCLDVRSESTPDTNTKPYGSLKSVQTWECSTNQDPYMAFTVLA